MIAEGYDAWHELGQPGAVLEVVTVEADVQACPRAACDEGADRFQARCLRGLCLKFFQAQASSLIIRSGVRRRQTTVEEYTTTCTQPPVLAWHNPPC